MTPDEAVREIAKCDDATVDGAIRRVLADTSLRIHPRLLVECADRGGRETRQWLHREVFAILHGAGNRIDAAYAVSTVSDDEVRHRLAAEVRAALRAGDEARLGAFVRRVVSFEVPTGYDMVQPHVHAGRTSRVALLHRLADDMIVAWKIPADDHADTRASMQRQVERAADWEKAGIPCAPAAWAPDGRTLLQPWIAGESLRAHLRKSKFLANPADARHAGLVDFLRTAAQASVFVTELGAEQIVFDGRKWRVIDSGEVRRVATASEAGALQRADCAWRWTGGEGAADPADVEAFLARADAAPGMPPRPFDLKRTLGKLFRRR